jgi:hypothetical protein
MGPVDGAGAEQVPGCEGGLLLGRQLADRGVVWHPLVGLGQGDAGLVGG